MNKKTIYYIIGFIFLVTSLSVGGYFSYNRYLKKNNQEKENTTKIATENKKVVENYKNELGNSEMDFEIDDFDNVIEKAKQEQEKVVQEIEKRKTEKGLVGKNESDLTEEEKAGLKYYYDKNDKGILDMDNSLFYGIKQTHDFINPVGYILDEDGEKIYLEEENESDDEIDFKDSMYARECVYMINPIIIKENKEEEVNKYLKQFEKDVEFFTNESHKFQISGGLEYILNGIKEFNGEIEKIKFGLNNKYLNISGKEIKNQELEIQNKIIDATIVRRYICENMFNFPIDREAPKRNVSGKIIIEKDKINEKETSKIENTETTKEKKVKKTKTKKKTSTKKKATKKENK